MTTIAMRCKESNDSIHVLWNDPICHKGRSGDETPFNIDMNAQFASRADKVLNKIDTAARTEPATIRIRVSGFDYYIPFEKDSAVESQVAERWKPSWRID